MKQLLRLSAFLCALVASSCTTASTYEFPPMPDFINGTPPPNTVAHWIRLNVLGDRNAPWPIIWISTQTFERQYPESLIVLQPDEYQALSTFVRANRCSTDEPRYPAWGTLKSTEHSDGQTVVLCVMSCFKARDYLSAILAIPQIAWTEKRGQILRLLQRGLGCYSNAPSAP